MITIDNCKKGFSLVELMVVIAITGILMAAATLEFSSMNKKSQIEKQTREVFSDFNGARTESLFRKKRHSIVFNATGNGYAFKRYSSENENKFAGTVVFNKTYSNQIKTETGGTIADNTTLLYDIRGFALDLKTVRIDPVGSGAVVDCIVISASRTNLGQMSGGSCVQK
jgi:type II secretion system protein H